MRNFYVIITIALLFVCNSSIAQRLQSSTEYLGYELGSKFTFHHQVIDYFEYMAQNSPKVVFQEYGKTAEGRPLAVAYISSPDNITNLEKIQSANLAAAAGKAEAKANQKTIVWLSYNIHGDEAAATEAAIATLEELVNGGGDIDDWLEDIIVIIDPCENPDGKDRYTMWINQVMNLPSNPDIDALEHHQPWPGGRFSHYLFDLNRDWAWQTQIESQQRIKLYHQWQPHVHVDFHEMGHQQSYFFAPAAEPMHDAITDWQREFQVHVGKNHAQYFDEKGWLYYTKEVFDLLYPSYGDTWPIFNGAIGFTYEQGGSGRASVAVTQETGQVLTLKQRLEHHKTTGLSTIETAYQFQDRLLNEFNDYFAKARKNALGEYSTYVIKYKDWPTHKAITTLLDRQKIYHEAPLRSGQKLAGYDYFTKQNNTAFTLEEKDIIITAKQSQSNLIRVLFEPETKLQDSLTYDLTAWALPYVYGTQTYALKQDIETSLMAFAEEVPEFDEDLYAYIAPWKNMKDIAFLSAVLNNKMNVRIINQPLKIEGRVFDRGSFMITKGDNDSDDFTIRLKKTITDLGYYDGKMVRTGIVDFGNDLGSSQMTYIKAPRVAILGGSGVSPTAFGEIWHYFEQKIDYPVSILHTEYFRQVDLDNYDVLILTNGRYRSLQSTGKLLSFVRDGGKIICIGTANNVFANERETQLGKSIIAARNQEEYGENPTGLKRYENRERASLSNSVAGSIYKVHLDNSHPLAYGYDTTTYIIKQNRSVYPLLGGNAWNVGMFKSDSHISGFVGAKLKPKIPQTMAFGVENLGRGQIVYLCDSPVFRGFWYSGNTLLANAIFFVN